MGNVSEQMTCPLCLHDFDPAYAPYLIPVGSITVDGISLTVARLEDDAFTVSIIPHTYEHTAVPTWREGTEVNLEFDLLGKYVVGWLSRREGVLTPRSEVRSPQ